MTSLQTERVSFPGYQGDSLAARLDSPSARPRGYAIFAHCFSCSKDLLGVVRISHALAARGIAVLRFDFTGLGNSGGDFANTNFSSNVQDLLQAAQFLREHYQAPKLLIGHSLGGAAVLAAAAAMPEVVAVSTLGAPSDPAHVTHFFEQDLAEIQAQGAVEVMLAGRKFRIQRQFLEDVAEQNLLHKVSTLHRPLLIFHSPVDSIVNIQHAARLYGAAKHPKSFVSLDDADHMLSRERDAVYVADVLVAWANRYLGEEVLPAEEAEEQPMVRVRETGESPFAQEVRIGRHVLRADEPIAQGGKDLGPSPYEYLLAGLGACTAMTLRVYSRQKEIPLQGVTVDLNHDKIHTEDCQFCETKVGKIDHIERVIHLQGRLDEQQRTRLLEIANKCPVHRTLHSEVEILSRLADE